MAHRVKLRSDDFDVVGAVPRDLSVIKNFLKRDCAVKRLIEIEEDFLQKCAAYEAKTKECSDGNRKKRKKSEPPPTPPPDPCATTTPQGEGGEDYCDPCRRLKTSVVLEELTRPAITNPHYAAGTPPYFDEETVQDSCQPIRFRFRRKPNSCDVEKPTKLPCTSTENTNVIVLANNSDVMVWPSQKVAQMNRVPVTVVSGVGDLTEFMLEEETIM